MNKHIIAFGTSNSRRSINKQLATYAAKRLSAATTTILDLNNFELPIYSVDLEKASGIPDNALRFSQYIQDCDGIIISLAEYNGLHTSVFKNLWDWMSRISTPKIWHGKAMFLLSTSPSKRPESYVTKVSKHLFPILGANIIASYHLPSFNHFFKDGQIVEPEQQERFERELQKFQMYLDESL